MCYNVSQDTCSGAMDGGKSPRQPALMHNQKKGNGNNQRGTEIVEGVSVVIRG